MDMRGLYGFLKEHHFSLTAADFFRLPPDYMDAMIRATARALVKANGGEVVTVLELMRSAVDAASTGQDMVFARSIQAYVLSAANRDGEAIDDLQHLVETLRKSGDEELQAEPLRILETLLKKTRAEGVGRRPRTDNE